MEEGNMEGEKAGELERVRASAKLAAAEGLLARAAETMATASRVSGTLPRVSRESLAEAVTLAQRALALIRRERPDVWDAVVTGVAEENDMANTI